MRAPISVQPSTADARSSSADQVARSRSSPGMRSITTQPLRDPDTRTPGALVWRVHEIHCHHPRRRDTSVLERRRKLGNTKNDVCRWRIDALERETVTQLLEMASADVSLDLLRREDLGVVHVGGADAGGDEAVCAANLLQRRGPGAKVVHAGAAAQPRKKLLRWTICKPGPHARARRRVKPGSLLVGEQCPEPPSPGLAERPGGAA